MELAADLAVFLLAPLAVLAAVDGLYIHLWRLRLHERPECRREHLLHTARALLFPLGLVLVYGYDTAGGWLLLGVGVVVVDTALEAWDTFEESASRRALGYVTGPAIERSSPSASPRRAVSRSPEKQWRMPPISRTPSASQSARRSAWASRQWRSTGLPAARASASCAASAARWAGRGEWSR